MMMSTFVVIIRIIFGRISIIYKELMAMLEHMKTEKRRYKEPNTDKDKYWFVKILYRVDRETQSFLYDCGHVQSIRA